MARKIPTIEVPKVADIPPGNITAVEWQAAQSDIQDSLTESNVLSALRFDPDHPHYGATRGERATEPGAIVKSANRQAIQMAANDARDAGGTLVIKGDYWIDGTITIECHVDGASGALLINDVGINPAVEVGRSSPNLSARHIVLPDIRQMGRASGSGWGGSDVGLRVNRLNQSNLWVTSLANFSVNMEMYSGPGGNCYNNIYLGIIHNHKIGLDFKTGTGGWVNENVFIGGRFVIDTAEGANIPGVSHIRIDESASGHPFNNNLFIKPSIEANAPEYHVIAGGMYNTILQGRWEASPPKVLWGDGSSGWVIQDGYNSQAIQFTGHSNYSRVQSRQSETWYSANSGGAGVMRLGGSSSASNPLVNLYPPGGLWSADLENDWMVSLGAQFSRWKNEGDAHPRIEINALNGRLSIGSGASSPTTYLAESAFGGLVLVSPGSAIRTGSTSPIMPQGVGPTVMAGTGDPNGSATASPGSIYLRSNGTIYRKSTGTGSSGWVAMS